MDMLESFAKYAPQYLPLVMGIVVIVLTRLYVYKGMVPETWLTNQIQREQQNLKEQIDRERAIVEGAKDIENRLEEIVRQLENLTKKVSEDVRESNARITSLERYLSDQRDDFGELVKSIQTLSFECEKHRKGIPETTAFRQERTS